MCECTMCNGSCTFNFVVLPLNDNKCILLYSFLLLSLFVVNATIATVQVGSSRLQL